MACRLTKMSDLIARISNDRTLELLNAQPAKARIATWIGLHSTSPAPSGTSARCLVWRR